MRNRISENALFSIVKKKTQNIIILKYEFAKYKYTYLIETIDLDTGSTFYLWNAYNDCYEIDEEYFLDTLAHVKYKIIQKNELVREIQYSKIRYDNRTALQIKRK